MIIEKETLESKINSEKPNLRRRHRFFEIQILCKLIGIKKISSIDLAILSKLLSVFGFLNREVLERTFTNFRMEYENKRIQLIDFEAQLEYNRIIGNYQNI